MTAASPRGMKERLLLAVDDQANIRNMMVVVEVISSLEKCFITKEELEETRLGKLINDIRKNTKNEGLAKRAKKLLRSWQKLIDPGQAPPALSKVGPELKARSDFNNCSAKPNKIKNRKRGCDRQLVQTKKPKITQHSKLLPPNGFDGNFKIAANISSHQPLDVDNYKYLDSKVHIRAVKPHPSASVHSKPAGAVMQQQVRLDKPRSPRCTLQHTENPNQEAQVKKTVSKTQNNAGPGGKVVTEDVSASGDSAPSFGLPSDHSGSANSLSRTSSTTVHESRWECVSLDENTINDAGKNKSDKHRAKDYVLNPDRPIRGENHRSVRLKDRKITFDPLTGQIKRTCPKDSSEEQEVSELLSGQLKPNQPVPPSPFQQTDWKQLSRSEIIQSYLTQQSNILLSSGALAPGAHFLMPDVCKRVDQRDSKATKDHVLAADHPAEDLPGVSREVSCEDLNRLQRQRWSGVNGCYDTKGNWYNWSQCISLDPHGDDSRLNIMPYVCMD